MNNLVERVKLYLQKLLRFVERNGTKPYLFASLALALLIAVVCTFSLSTSYAIVIDGKTMGQVSSEETVSQAMTAAKEKVQQESGREIVAPYNTVETKIHHSLFAPRMQEEEVEALLAETIQWLTPGAMLNIDNGEEQYALASREDGQAVLDQLKSAATAGIQSTSIKSVDFLEDVVLSERNVKLSDIQSPDAILAEIQAGKEELKIHKVKEGETFWTIAQDNAISVEDLQALNSDIVPELLQIGQEIKLNKLEPLLNVVVTEELTVEESIPHPTEYKDTSALLKGETKVVTKGEDGKKEITYEVKVSNGETLEKNLVKEVVLAEPVTEVVNKGTGSIQISSRSSGYSGGSGVLSWPKSGKITSPYGTRSRGFHSGIDISAKVGESVYAAAGGKVVLASWYYGYGNCILIDHGNGMKTRYAHLSSYNCKVGDTVSRGQLIAHSGNTGNTTGPHLHFEVIVNGSTKNPVNYLR